MVAELRMLPQNRQIMPWRIVQAQLLKVMNRLSLLRLQTRKKRNKNHQDWRELCQNLLGGGWAHESWPQKGTREAFTDSGSLQGNKRIGFAPPFQYSLCLCHATGTPNGSLAIHRLAPRIICVLKIPAAIGAWQQPALTFEKVLNL